MHRIFRHWHAGDFRLLGLSGLTLLFIGLFLWQQTGERGPAVSGWRQLDQAALMRRLESGDLSDREALWYHPTTLDELPQRGHRVLP